MAENSQQGRGATVNSFNKGMVKDYNDTFVADGLYTHARNAVNNSHEGQVGVIGNEPANLFCVNLPYTMIGAIHTINDEWVIFTTDDTNSEIGLFDESACTYTKIVNDPCLGFKRTHLITGVFRYRFDCERLIYWDDGLNPSRVMNIDDVPFKFTTTILNGCITQNPTNQLDCERIRLAPLVKHPCITIAKGNLAGTLPNGSYQACIAYTINQTKVTDYIGLSEVQGLFEQENVSSSLILTINSIDQSFDEFELVILSNINGQTVAKRIGIYPTSQGTIYIDRWDPEYITVPIADVVLRTEPVEKSDAMYMVNNYLLRVGTYSKFKFNYQLQANNILAKWVAVEYPADYYVKGGNNTGYLRDEQYAFFIRWIYNTGERSESYHIPGRAPLPGERANVTGADAFETAAGIPRQLWQVQNTGLLDSTTVSTLPDGGVVIGKGRMGFWESTQIYPSTRPDIWGNLCGQPIRHHKMPDVTINGGNLINHFNSAGTKIVLLGVQFEGITHPLDLNGNPITSIIGYEILRGSREGAKSIVAKGIINNMREYTIPNTPNVKGLFQNYPYNDLRPDVFLTENPVFSSDGLPRGQVTVSTPPMTGYRQDVFSFHSPETSFSTPFLNTNEIKVYQLLSGKANGRFETPYQHPKFKVVSDIVTIIAKIAGLMTAVAAVGQGITLAATEDLPVSLQFGPIGKPPAFPSAAGGEISGPIQVALAWAKYAADLIIWASEVATITALANALADVTSEKLIQLFSNIVPKKQYASQYNSHGFYNSSLPSIINNRRREITDASYVKAGSQQFTGAYQINNLYRNRYVVLKINGAYPNPSIVDNSRFKIESTQAGGQINKNISSDISSYYGAIKIPIPSQYGQLESIKQVTISNCVEPTPGVKNLQLTSSVTFGGDTYINRYTEKNSMVFFNTWLRGEPDEIEFDYRLYMNLPFPRYWINNTQYHSAFLQVASDLRALDDRDSSVVLYVNRGYFYLFNSGVRDFFVESEVNLAYRDWEEVVSKRHYDPYRFTDITSMFRSDIIKEGNYYKYDYSLSVSKLVNSQITWGNILSRDYDPNVAATCYTYVPTRVIYSLPQQDEAKKDNWRVFLANNYNTFLNRVTAIKPINKTGALFLMDAQGPLQFLGVEELQLDGTGTKVTIGDGKLFDGPRQLQSVVNADDPYEYGSSQNRYAIINTTKGVFWVSQNQGKVFQYAGGLKEISAMGMRWWFAKYLPSQLLLTYPGYPLYDNIVKGVGVSMVYDNTTEIVYISKRDYKPKVSNLTFDANGNFFSGSTPVALTNTNYFEPASWTISFDTKSSTWTSFHDWIPTFLLPGKNHFMSVNGNSIWKHNVRCDLFCNFYNQNYPWEVEWVSATGQQVNTVRSVEYLIEGYKYFNDCRDKFHILDANFDQAMIYNSEQISGLLNLILPSKSNPLDMLTYPRINPTSIDINFSKEEQKYRINQFWDVTKDRGEFSGATVPIILTQPNGYQYGVNPTAVNYSKAALQRKKFRHFVNRVWMRKNVSGDTKYYFKLSNQKLQPSYR
jgi:hypothetical protein